MVSEKQQTASTANTQKGGVKTEEGKAIVRLNAIIHGLTSKEVLPSEDGETLGTLREHLMAELQPQEELETLLADLIVSDTWWLRRAVKMETVYLEGILEWGTKQIEGKSPEVIMAKLKMAPRKLLAIDAIGEQGGLFNLERYRTSIEWHLYKSLNEFYQLLLARHD